MSETGGGGTGGSSSPGRYARTTNGLIGSMIITLVVIGAFVAFRALTRDNAETKPQAVDYLETVSEVQAGGVSVVYPSGLPPGWIATSVDVVPGDSPAFGVGILTDSGKFVGVRQEDAPVSDLLKTYVDKQPDEGDPVDVTGSVAPTWQTWSDTDGDRAFSAEVGGDVVLVYGSASTADQLELLGRLTTEPVAQQ